MNVPLSDIFPSALWLEREVREFFGISLQAIPSAAALILPEEADYHPLQKTLARCTPARTGKVYG